MARTIANTCSYRQRRCARAGPGGREDVALRVGEGVLEPGGGRGSPRGRVEEVGELLQHPLAPVGAVEAGPPQDPELSATLPTRRSS